MNWKIYCLTVTFSLVYLSHIMAADLKNETLGDIGLGNSVDTVKKKYGSPKTIDETKDVEPATGCRYLIYKYESEGLEIGFCNSVDTKSVFVSHITATGLSKAKTSKGIGIGSSPEEIKKAYPDANSSEGEVTVRDEGDSWSIIIFTIGNGKVTSISLSPLPE